MGCFLRRRRGIHPKNIRSSGPSLRGTKRPMSLGSSASFRRIVPFRDTSTTESKIPSFRDAKPHESWELVPLDELSLAGILQLWNQRFQVSGMQSRSNLVSGKGLLLHFEYNSWEFSPRMECFLLIPTKTSSTTIKPINCVSLLQRPAAHITKYRPWLKRVMPLVAGLKSSIPIMPKLRLQTLRH